MATEPSLKARAVAYLSRREHSRAELARKLAPYAESGEEIDALLDTLAREGWQSDARYAQSWLHRKAPQHGNARLLHDLRAHGLATEDLAEMREQLRESEPARARAVWAKRFGAPPQNAADYARQARFLAARGFAHELIRKVLAASHDFDDGTCP